MKIPGAYMSRYYKTQSFISEAEFLEELCGIQLSPFSVKTESVGLRDKIDIWKTRMVRMIKNHPSLCMQ